jgi:hypothetical protein
MATVTVPMQLPSELVAKIKAQVAAISPGKKVKLTWQADMAGTMTIGVGTKIATKNGMTFSVGVFAAKGIGVSPQGGLELQFEFTST